MWSTPTVSSVMCPCVRFAPRAAAATLKYSKTKTKNSVAARLLYDAHRTRTTTTEDGERHFCGHPRSVGGGLLV